MCVSVFSLSLFEKFSFRSLSSSHTSVAVSKTQALSDKYTQTHMQSICIWDTGSYMKWHLGSSSIQHHPLQMQGDTVYTTTGKLGLYGMQVIQETALN